MIPYSDLVAALRHWRARNGLPIAGGDVGPPPAAYVPNLPGPPPAPYSQGAYDGQSGYGDYGGGGETMDAEEIGVQEIEGEEIYEGDAGDAAMAFGAGVAPTTEPAAYGGEHMTYGDPYGGTTDGGATDPYAAGGAYADEAPAEAAPVETKPQGIIVDPDTHDTTVPDEEAPAPSGKKKKRRR